MFDKPYTFQKLTTTKTFLQNPIEKTNYRFKAAQRTYFVTFEVFDFGIAAIKYCDVKDKDSHNAYKKIYNDFDAFRVIGTCLHIMLHYWKEHPNTSFGFYAVPRDTSEVIIKSKSLTDAALHVYIERYKAARFNVYRDAMLNLFSPKYFKHASDQRNSMYLLVNHVQQDYKVIVKKIATYLLENSDLIFDNEAE